MNLKYQLQQRTGNTLLVIWLNQYRTTDVYLGTIKLLTELSDEDLLFFTSCLDTKAISDDNKMYELASHFTKRK